MKKVFLSLAAIALAVAANAQLLDVTSVQRVDLPQGITVDQAVISPDGSFVAATSNTDNGLNQISLANGTVSRVSDNAASYGIMISADGNTIAWRQPSYNSNHLRHLAVMAFDRNSGRTTTLVSPTRKLQGVSLVGQTVLAVEGGKLKAKAVGGAAAVKAPVASIVNGALYITANGRTANISPQGTTGNSYLWPEISPDGKKVSYYLATVGAFVCNIDGSNPVYLGVLRAAKWLDNETLVAMHDTDNGEFVTESQVIAVKADGSVRQTLTDSSVRAMYPSANADGSRIAFSTPEGNLYVINVNR